MPVLPCTAALRMFSPFRGAVSTSASSFSSLSSPSSLAVVERAPAAPCGAAGVTVGVPPGVGETPSTATETGAGAGAGAGVVAGAGRSESRDDGAAGCVGSSDDTGGCGSNVVSGVPSGSGNSDTVLRSRLPLGPRSARFWPSVSSPVTGRRVSPDICCHSWPISSSSSNRFLRPASISCHSSPTRVAASSPRACGAMTSWNC